ncbi:MULTISPECIES: hypothetical protein [Streptomyces]|uniref:hypothetical protein n=1 Tax=Streptomyces TaxID=1883 RepID=UPI00166FEAED|nr:MULTISPECIES: hypothetical protein [Streptomyces]UFR04412.1 hypothetical protein KBP30_26035 [Streptomyces sp. Go40/10]GGS45913.1 hypothetical protein GCM10010206_04540 [Streptomyces cinerochromogenes]
MNKILGVIGTAVGVGAAQKFGSRVTDMAFDAVQKYLADHPGALKNAARTIAVATGTAIAASAQAVAAFLVTYATPILIGTVVVVMIAGVVVLVMKASSAQTA